MIIGLASDIHTEISGQRTLELPCEVDLLLLAGDIGKGVQSIEYCRQFLDKAKNVVIIFGNHDYWRGSSIQKTINQAREYAKKESQIHFLENDMIEIDGVNIIGSTCWTNFSYGVDSMYLNMLDAENNMNDYRFIKWQTGNHYRRIRADDVLKLNHESKNFIFESLSKVDRMKSIVMTHHAPTQFSIHPQYLGDSLNHCYANMWGNDIAYNGPKLWVHGHIHMHSEYVIGETTILCNPIGYPGQYEDTQIKIFEMDF